MNEVPSSIAKAQTVMFRIDGDRATCSTTQEEADSFREEVDYLHYFVVKIGEGLGMRMIDYGMFLEGGARVAFRFNRTHGIQTAAINGLVSTAPLGIRQVLDEL